MLRILGSQRTLCGGVSRRDMLRMTGLGMASLGMGNSAASLAAASDRPRSFGKAKSVILLHLYGSPSQLEFVDPKPDAPVEIRGTLGTIDSSLPGCGACELLPNLAKVLDRTTVLRSMTHPYPLHGVAYALTGVPAIDVPMELNPTDPRHWPFIGSVVDYMDTLDARAAAASQAVPQNLALPFPFSTQRTGETHRAGPYAAFLGAQHNPVWTEWRGKATRGITKKLGAKVFDGNDPYIGCDDNTHFVIPAATDLLPELTLDRLNGRRSLLQQFEAVRRNLDASAAGVALNRQRAMAYDLLQSDGLRQALDIRREKANVRALYGDTLFGQSCLAARRLVEAGGRVITVFWDEFGLAGSAWDTHKNHYERMEKELCPGLDQAWFGLLTDLEQRGLLDDTLVVCTSEHGRTPKLNKDLGGGRDHWSRVYTSLVAGGGTTRGNVIGASDRHGSDVADRPISPKDLLATIYHLLGIDHHRTLTDNLGRPLPLVEGEVIREALA